MGENQGAADVVLPCDGIMDTGVSGQELAELLTEGDSESKEKSKY